MFLSRALLGLIIVGLAGPLSAQDYVPRRYRDEAPQPVRLPVSQTVPASYFSGSWGQVSFNTQADIPKMRAIARQYCGPLAVPIRLATPTTFMMYVTTALKEVQVYDQNGQSYIIPVEQMDDGIIRDARELKILDQNAFTLHYLQEEAHQRYGNNIFVRCGSREAQEKTEEPRKKPRLMKNKGKKKTRN